MFEILVLEGPSSWAPFSVLWLSGEQCTRWAESILPWFPNFKAYVLASIKRLPISSWNRNGRLLQRPSKSFASHWVVPTKKKNDSLSWLQMWGPFVKKNILVTFPEIRKKRQCQGLGVGWEALIIGTNLKISQGRKHVAKFNLQLEFITLLVSTQCVSLSVNILFIYLFAWWLSSHPYLNGSPKRVGTFLAVFPRSNKKTNPP